MVLRVFKMIATSGFLTAFECTKFVFGRALPRTPLQRSSRPSSWFKGPISKGERREGEEKGREEGDRKGTGETAPLSKIP